MHTGTRRKKTRNARARDKHKNCISADPWQHLEPSQGASYSGTSKAPRGRWQPPSCSSASSRAAYRAAEPDSAANPPLPHRFALHRRCAPRVQTLEVCRSPAERGARATFWARSLRPIGALIGAKADAEASAARVTATRIIAAERERRRGNVVIISLRISS